MVRNLLIPQRELRALRELAACDVEYLLVGGYAVRHYGIDREANDVDVFVSTTPENAARLYAAIVNIIGHFPDFEAERLSEPRKHISFKDDGLLLDILTTLPGIDFGEAFQAREVAAQDGTCVLVISKQYLLVSKRAAADKDPTRRERELRDVAMLEGV